MKNGVAYPVDEPPHPGARSPRGGLVPIVGRMTKRLCLALAFLALLAPPFAALSADLAVGAPAPAFSLRGSDGATHTLAQHVGQRGVVLAWFPKAFTPG